MAKHELSFCYFNDLPENERPEIVICNECGFFASLSDCKYAMCPFATPERCKECNYMEFSDKIEVGRCVAPISMLERYTNQKGMRA